MCRNTCQRDAQSLIHGTVPSQTLQLSQILVKKNAGFLLSRIQFKHDQNEPLLGGDGGAEFCYQMLVIASGLSQLRGNNLKYI